jgi:anti-anti-sigma factor
MLRIAEREIGGGRCELRLEGELDLWSAERLQAVLERVGAGHDAVLVGLEECEFVDSTGVAIFLRARRGLERTGGRLLFYGGAAQVRRVFEMAGLADAGMVFADRRAALAELGPPRGPDPSQI